MTIKTIELRTLRSCDEDDDEHEVVYVVFNDNDTEIYIPACPRGRALLKTVAKLCSDYALGEPI